MGTLGTSHRQEFSGIISRLRLENFMCHSNLEIQLGEFVNFVTGQNGSGKSAILTALCVAFGCRAKDTSRASTLKDFIKTGSSYAVVCVEIRNQGDDAFKPDTYGDMIIIERRISETTSSIVLKDHQGKRVASRRDELRELVDHFNIDVENPCVVMSQDKSREFLHSGNDKDKFKFFFKATLLQQVNDLLLSIKNHLTEADKPVKKLEQSVKAMVQDTNNLQGKIRNMEHVEEISLQVQQLRKKLAWAWVYDVDRQLQEHHAKIEKLKERIPTCQARIDAQLARADELKQMFILKKTQSALLMEKTSEVRRLKEELEQRLSLAKKAKLELEEEHKRKSNYIQNLVKRVISLEKQIREAQEQHIDDTQAEEFEVEGKLKVLQDEVDAANLIYTRLKEDENSAEEILALRIDEIRKIVDEIQDMEKKYREIYSNISELRKNQSNKVTAFGGDRVINLLRAIERHEYKFTRPPIGPIGAHVTMVDSDMWAPAVENAMGRLLNAFVVTNHKDSLLLRGCAKEANYHHLQIIIYDFSRPRLNVPNHMLPQTNHPTTLSVLHSENATVLNVLVDMGNAERQVLVKDYNVGKTVAFEQKISNLKEVYTLEGHRMFSRGSVQTILPPNKRIRTGRLCKSFDIHITELEKNAEIVKNKTQQVNLRKRTAEEEAKVLQDNFQNAKKRRLSAERNLMNKTLKLQDVKNSLLIDKTPAAESTVDEISQDISKLKEEIGEKKLLLEKFRVRINEADATAEDLKNSLENLRESTKDEIDTFEEAEHEIMRIEENLRLAEAEKLHYEGVMNNKVLPDIKDAEAKYKELEHSRKDSCGKASIICSESEVEALGGCSGSTPEQLSAQLNRLTQRLQQESERYAESIDDLRVNFEKKQQMLLKKKAIYEAFVEKLQACDNALNLRWEKFQRNATLLKRQLTWQFNSHLKKKGISGKVKVSYEDRTLSLEVKMPQDASNNIVRDTRGLSGGERSFSTLCFALALHDMTEAPFRAMDEFDVFMDAVSRKISLDTLVDFALAEGSQWIFITPHDISMVKAGAKIKKQQMAAPRS